MTFSESITTCFRKSFSFEGRASRSEYWYFYLFEFIVVLLLEMMIIGSIGAPLYDFLNILLTFFSFACLPASISVCVRRLHDTNHSGWNVWWGLIPIAGALYLLYLTVKKGDSVANNYGSIIE